MDAYTSVHNHRVNDGAPMIDLVGGSWEPRTSFYAFKQLFKSAQAGAQRIGTSGPQSNLVAIAFYNPSSGQITIVGHNQTGSRNMRISLANLPAVGAMQLYVTDNFGTEFARRADVTLVNGVAAFVSELDEFFTLTASSGPDTTAPTVTMLAPAGGATVLGTATTVSASAADNISIAGVQFKLDGANLGPELTTTPFSIAWNTTAVSNGLHTLSAVARDGSGNIATATPVSVTVNNPIDLTPPTVSITAPANGASVSGSNVAVTATAADDIGVVGVQFFLDGAPLGAEVMAAPFTVSWDTTAGSLGSHTLTARARDGAGRQTTSAAVTVTVVTPPPGTLTIDATAFGDRGSPALTVVSSAFSTTSADQLLVALIAADDVTTRNTVTNVSGGGLTWTLVIRTNASRGTAEIWRAVAATALTNVSVTATLAQSSALVHHGRELHRRGHVRHERIQWHRRDAVGDRLERSADRHCDDDESELVGVGRRRGLGQGDCSNDGAGPDDGPSVPGTRRRHVLGAATNRPDADERHGCDDQHHGTDPRSMELEHLRDSGEALKA